MQRSFFVFDVRDGPVSNVFNDAKRLEKNFCCKHVFGKKTAK
jgi:hypothetical protein